MSDAESDRNWPLAGPEAEPDAEQEPARTLEPARIPDPEPAAPEPNPAPEPGPTPNRDPDDPDRTVDRAALLAAGLGPGQSHTAHAGPTVLAALCTRGHLNPPTNATCRTCGRAVPEQQPYETPRPALGILRLSTGDTVTLDRGVIMGRAPQAPPGLPPDLQPHVVRIASPQRDLSRNHVQIVLEGWQVIVRDLDTTNGTTITPRDGQPQRLRGGEAQVIDLGAAVDLAGEVTFVYEPEPSSERAGG